MSKVTLCLCCDLPDFGLCYEQVDLPGIGARNAPYEAVQFHDSSLAFMNTLKRIGRILFAALLCAAAPVMSAPDTVCGERVTLGELIANPDVYHGKALWVIANVTIDFENMTACPSDNKTEMKNCLWLDIVDADLDYARYESKLQIWERFNLQTVALHATFDKGEKGHFSMWPGGLRGVTEVSGGQDSWDFIANAPILKKCIDQ